MDFIYLMDGMQYVEMTSDAVMHMLSVSYSLAANVIVDIDLIVTYIECVQSIKVSPDSVNTLQTIF